MSIIFDQYEERLNRRKRSKSTIDSFKSATEGLSKYLTEEGTDPEKVEGWQIEEYLATSPYAPTTKKLHLAHIGAAYRYAHRRGLISRDPTIDVEVERVPEKPPRTIPNATLREIKKRLVGDREWLAFHLLAYTGMRRTEIRRLQWDAISFEDNTITVVGKGSKLRYVPIHPALSEVLHEKSGSPYADVLAGRRGGVMGERTWWSTVHAMTGGEYSSHDFRRTVASSLYENGVDGDIIDEIMGWARIGIRRKHYQRIAPARLQRAILQLYRDDPI